MSDLVKSLMGGGWSLIIGWILPVFISLQLVAALVLPGARNVVIVNEFLRQSPATRQFALLAGAAVLGLVLAAAQAPLYRIIEGYILWPAPVAASRITAHRARRSRLVSVHAGLAGTDRGVHAGLAYERAARYPASDKQFAPTLLGNAIRRFETYAGDRYQMDSQLLWHHLTAAAPSQAVDAVDRARASVDFFVCLLYGGVVTAVLGAIVVATGNASIRPILAIVIGLVLAILCYWLAVVATDEWDAAVRAVVDLGRAGVAAAFGLALPAHLTDERYMWRAVNTLVRRPFSYSESKNVPGILGGFKAADPEP